MKRRGLQPFDLSCGLTRCHSPRVTRADTLTALRLEQAKRFQPSPHATEADSAAPPIPAAEQQEDEAREQVILARIHEQQRRKEAIVRAETRYHQGTDDEDTADEKEIEAEMKDDEAGELQRDSEDEAPPLAV